MLGPASRRTAARRPLIEDLKVRNMTARAAGTVEQPGRNVRQKSGLNRSMLDVAPHQIRVMLDYKAAWYGSRVIAVNRKRYERPLLPESGSVIEIARGLTGHGGYDGGWRQASSQA